MAGTLPSSPNAKSSRGGVSHDHKRISDSGSARDNRKDSSSHSAEQLKSQLAAKEKQCLELEARVQDMAAGRQFNNTVLQHFAGSSQSKSENRTGSFEAAYVVAGLGNPNTGCAPQPAIESQNAEAAASSAIGSS